MSPFRFMGEQEDPEMDTIEARGGTRVYDGTEPSGCAKCAVMTKALRAALGMEGAANQVGVGDALDRPTKRSQAECDRITAKILAALELAGVPK